VFHLFVSSDLISNTRLLYLTEILESIVSAKTAVASPSFATATATTASIELVYIVVVVVLKGLSKCLKKK
jgi:hypothetical protein